MTRPRLTSIASPNVAETTAISTIPSHRSRLTPQDRGALLRLLLPFPLTPCGEKSDHLISIVEASKTSQLIKRRLFGLERPARLGNRANITTLPTFQFRNRGFLGATSPPYCALDGIVQLAYEMRTVLGCEIRLVEEPLARVRSASTRDLQMTRRLSCRLSMVAGQGGNRPMLHSNVVTMLRTQGKSRYEIHQHYTHVASTRRRYSISPLA